jgi:GNAT superfamily N-acetyltransferase
VTDLIDETIDTDGANFALGNETFEMAGALFVRSLDSPNIYDANHATRVRARTPQEIDELLAAMEREFQHSGHRRFDVDYRTPPEFVARLALESFVRDDGLLMLLEGELRGAPPRACDIRPLQSEADWEAFWELTWLDWNEHHEKLHRDPKEEVARQMWRAKKRKQPPVQYWLAYEGERAVAYFNSWEGVDGVGQVEDLFTHPEYRKRGYATALIHHCVREARAKGAGPIVIAADPTDTPKNIYARMGWRPVAVLSKMQKVLGERVA